MALPTPKDRPNPFAALGFHSEDDDTPTSERIEKKIYVMGINADVAGGPEWNDYEVVSGDYDPDKGEIRPCGPRRYRLRDHPGRRWQQTAKSAAVSCRFQTPRS